MLCKLLPDVPPALPALITAPLAFAGTGSPDAEGKRGVRIAVHGLAGSKVEPQELIVCSQG